MEENRLDMVNLYVRQNVRSGVSEVKNPEQGVEWSESTPGAMICMVFIGTILLWTAKSSALRVRHLSGIVCLSTL